MEDTTKQLLMPSPQDPVDWSDYFVGSLYVTMGVGFAVLIAWFYWYMHGGSLDTFSVWSTGDKKWLEVIFWSFFTKHAWNITDVSYEMAHMRFQKRYVWVYISQTFEAPPISLSLVYILVNFGVTISSITLSLEEVPIEMIIALAVISSYFSREAVSALQKAASWLFEVKKEPES